MATPAREPAFPLPKGAGLFVSPGKHNLILCLLLVVATLALYNPVSRNDFVNYDDDRYVLENSHVRAGIRWDTVSWAFTSLEQANWHPLTWLSHALDCQLFRLNPAGHHYMSLLLHVANVLLLFLLLQSLTGYAGRSFLVAALFAVHPVNVESVAWVAERKNVLCMLFFLLALAAYARYVRRPRISRYLLVAFLFTMGLMSKPMIISLPFLLLLLDYWPLGRMRPSGSTPSQEEACSGGLPFAHSSRSLPWLILEKIPLLMLSAGSAIITLAAQRAGGAVVSGTTHPLSLRLENAVVSYVLYIAKAVWPSHLAALYPYPHSLSAWKVAASAVFLLAVTAGVLKYRNHLYLLVGWFWYLGAMVPMIGLVQVGNQAMADRYAYLPLVGLFVGIVWGAAEIANSLHVPAQYLAAAAVVALVALSVTTNIQVRYWHDDLSLWAHALDVTRNNFVAENNFGRALTRQGRYEEAAVHFRAAAAMEPGDAVSQFNLGIYAQEHGDWKQAVARYDNAVRLASDPQLLSLVYANLGGVYFSLHDYSHARENFESAIKMDHSFSVALLHLGLIAQRTGDGSHAIDYYRRLVEVAPSDVGYLLLAQALERGGRIDDAKAAAEQAQRLSADLVQARQTARQLLEE